jgi:DNA-binding transcriptional LysR family regulator
MIETHLRDVDLNLLLVLHVLLEEGSVTRAAARLGRTQPAISRSLGRLRDLLGDPLLVREGAGLVRTARAEALEEPVRKVLLDVLGQVLVDDPFTPATAVRTFSIASSDYAERVFLPSALARVASEAPGVSLRLELAGRPVDAVADHDLLLAPISDAPDSVRSRPVLEDGFVCLVRRDHPRVTGAMDLDTYVDLPHLLVAPRGRPGSVVDAALAARGLARRIAVQLRSFLVAPVLVATSDMVWTVPRHLARVVAREHALRQIEPPLPLPTFTIRLAWHERWHHDPGHAWLRALIASEARAMVAPLEGT